MKVEFAFRFHGISIENIIFTAIDERASLELHERCALKNGSKNETASQQQQTQNETA